MSDKIIRLTDLNKIIRELKDCGKDIISIPYLLMYLDAQNSYYLKEDDLKNLLPKKVIG